MNDMVLFLVVAAALIFVGLFVWSRMEAKKSEGQNISLTQEPNTMYQKLRSVIPSKGSDAASVTLVHTEEQPVEEQVQKASSINATEELKVQEEPPSKAEVPVTPTQEKAPEPVVEPKVVEAPVVPKAEEKVETTKQEEPKVEEEKTNEAFPTFLNGFSQKQTDNNEVVKPIEPVSNTNEKASPVFDLVEEPSQPAQAPVKKEPEELLIPVKPTFPKEGMLNFEFDDLTESVGMIQAMTPLTGTQMLDMAKNLRKLNLPIRIYVRSIDNKRWYEPRAEGSYNEMAVVLLLATRQSFINEMDASRFAVAIQQAGIALDADSDTEPAQEIERRAKRLYDAITSLDVQLSIVLSSREVIPTQELSEAARLAGFTQLNPTRFFLGNAKQIGEATIFLRVADYDRHQLTLVLDAPLATPNSKPLHQLFSVANDLSCRLGLEMQDTRGQPINSEAAQAIHNQLSKYYQQMSRAEIQPGSPRSRILFSRE